MISKKKYNRVFGCLVGYEHNIITGETCPLVVLGLNIIPEMFEYFIIHTFEKYFGSGRYNLLWKQKLTTPEYDYWMKTTDVTPVIRLCYGYIYEIADVYTKFEELILTETGLDEFTKEYQRLTPEQIQEARKYYILDSDGVPVVPADSVPAAPVVVPVAAAADPAPAVAADSVPSGFVPAVIQGEFAEIQGSVRDSKRETTLTEQKKTNEILESKLDRLIELQEKNIEASTQTARNSWTIAETSQKTAALLEQRIKPNTDLRERAAAFKQLKNKYSKIMKCRAEFWFQYCLPIGLDWKGVYEGENGSPCDLTGEELERNRSLYEKSIREYRKDDYDRFKKQKKQE